MVMDIHNLQGIRMLFIDDCKAEQEQIAQLLQDMEIQCSYASNSREALTLLLQEKFDIIFIDYMMPEEDGITALCKILGTHTCDEIPIVVVADSHAGLARQNYLNAGFTGYLEKPITKERLFNTILHCINLTIGNEPDEYTINQVLVVDDDEMNLFLAKRILEAQFDVHTVSSGKQALQYLQNHTINLILLDIHMPEMDGFTFFSIIKKDPLLKEIPIICLTADNDPASELKCFELGAIDFITKPFIAQIMLQRINRILDLELLQKSLQKEVERKTLSLNRRSRQLNRLTIQVMTTLAKTIDAKDKYTNGHSIRVAEYSKMIAQKLNMTLHEQEDIYYIGLLHDIGKIGIPDEIINKPSGLTDEEYTIIKTHPVIGSEILAEMSELPEIALGARWHHERYDGRGYPDGLKGENIPLIARIIGVADAYDAMSSKRSYRDVLPQAYIREEIQKCMGTQFDPEIAKLMIQIIDEDKEYHLREW